MSALADIAATLREEGGLLADALAGDAALAALPSSDGDAAFVLEAVYEGWRLHAADPQRPPRIVVTDDEDLALLAGDRLYALGLAKLAEIGDLDSVAVLADVIAQSARARLEDRPEQALQAFDAGASAMGWLTEPPSRFTDR